MWVVGILKLTSHMSKGLAAFDNRTAFHEHPQHSILFIYILADYNTKYRTCVKKVRRSGDFIKRSIKKPDLEMNKSKQEKVVRAYLWQDDLEWRTE